MDPDNSLQVQVQVQEEFLALAQAQTDEDAKRLFASHPALHRLKFDPVIDAMIENAVSMGAPDEVLEVLRDTDRYRRHLRFAEAIEVVAHADERLAATEDPGVANEAAEACRIIMAHRDLASLEFDFAESLFEAVGSVLIHVYYSVGDPGNIMLAVGALEGCLALAEMRGHDRPNALSNLGAAHLQQAQQNHDAALEDAAIDELRRAAQASPPAERAWILAGLAAALVVRYRDRGSPVDLDEACRTAAEAKRLVAESSDPNDLPWVLLQYGRSFLAMYRRSRKRMDLREAVKALETGIEVSTGQGRRDPGMWLELGSALLERFEFAGEPEDLDLAIGELRIAHEMAGLGHPMRFESLTMLARALGLRRSIEADPEADEAETALLQEAVNLSEEGTREHAHALVNLANALVRRQRNRHLDAQLHRVIVGLEAAVSTRLTDHEQVAVLVALARCLRQSSRKRGLDREFATAMSKLREAAALDRVDAPARAAILNNLGNLCLDRYSRSHQTRDLEMAIGSYEEALSLGGRTDDDISLVLSNLADCLRRRSGLASRPQRMSVRDRSRAIDLYRKAAKAAGTTSPKRAFECLVSWAGWAAQREAWGEVAEAAELGQHIGEGLVGVSNHRDRSVGWLREVSLFSHLGAWAAAKLNDCRRAQMSLERGHSVLLAETMRVREQLDRLVAAGHVRRASRFIDASAALGRTSEDVRERDRSGNADPIGQARRVRIVREPERAAASIRRLPGFQRFLRPPDPSTIRESLAILTAAEPLVHLVPGPEVGLAFLDGIDGSSRTLELPDVGEEVVRERVGTYVDALLRRRRQPEAWTAELDRTCQWLWDRIMSPVIQSIGAAPGATVSLVPCGLLAMMPLHAACAPGNSGEELRYAIDRIAVRYAPNALVMIAAREKAARLEVGAFLGVDNPQPTSLPWLETAEREITGASRFFRTVVRLSKTEATRERLLGEVAQASVIHFACHGHADLLEPANSGLAMSHDVWTTVRDLAQVRLDKTRLVVLSACESAQPGVAAVDEILGLPTGFMEAGAAGVIGTLWSIDDVAATVLMTRFYELWRGDGQDPVAALASAQRWMRDLSTIERATAFPDLDFGGSGDPGDYPYRHPIWWGAFSYTGA